MPLNSKKTDWDARLFALALHISKWSKDPSTKVGSVIARGNRVLSLGYNGFPRGVADDDRLRERKLKYRITQHAERNALDQAEFSVEGCTIYSTLCPCNECVKSIIQRGIKRVVTIEPPESLKDKWNFDLTHKLFNEVGIHFEYIGEQYD